MIIPKKDGPYDRNWRSLEFYLNRTNSAIPSPTVPLTTVPYVYTGTQPAVVYISGGTVSAIALSGTTTGLTSGTFYLNPGQVITITYTGTPTWKWFYG